MVSKANDLIERLEGEGPLIGLWCSLGSATAVEVLSVLSFDWLLLDMEHAVNEVGDVVDQLRVLDACSISAVVRPPSTDDVIIKRLLDAGAKNLLFPHVDSVAQAESIVRATRYPPFGNRGFSTAGRVAAYGARRDYLDSCPAELRIAVQVESTEAFEVLDGISRVVGVDIVFFGPGDLSADMGLLGQVEHPSVQELIVDGIRIVRSAGKVAGVLAPNPRTAKKYFDAGARFIAIGSDIGCLRGRAQALASEWVPEHT